MSEYIKHTTKRIDLGTATGLATILVAVTVFNMNQLSNTISDSSIPSISGLFWTLSTLFSASLSFISVVALITKAVAMVDKNNYYAWENISNKYYKICILIISQWIIIWLPCYFVVTSLIIYINTNMKYLYIMAITIFIGATSAFIIYKLSPIMNSTIKSIQNDIHGIGFLRGAFLIIILYIFVFIILNSCYKFDLNTVNSILTNDQILEIQVTLRGRIFEHESLRLQIVLENETIPTEEQIFKPIKVIDGKYILWKDLSDFSPGIYRATAFFDGYSKTPSILKKIKGKINNYQRRSVLFIIRQK